MPIDHITSLAAQTEVNASTASFYAAIAHCKEAANLLHAFVNHLPAAFVLSAGDRNEVIVNDAFAKLFGITDRGTFPPDMLLNCPIVHAGGETTLPRLLKTAEPTRHTLRLSFLTPDMQHFEARLYVADQGGSGILFVPGTPCSDTGGVSPECIERGVSQALYEHVQDYVFVKDAQKRYVWFNRAFRRLIPQGKGAMPDMGTLSAYDIFPPEQASEFSDEDDDILHGRRNQVERLSQVYLKTTEQKRWLYTIKVPFLSQGRVAGVLGISRDVSRMKEQELALEEAKALFQSLNQTKDLFMGIVSHDLRNPLHNIMGFSELILKKGDLLPAEKLRTYVSLIHQSAEQAGALVDNLLDWTNSQTGRLAPLKTVFRMEEAVSDTLSLLQLSAERKKISLTAFVADDIEVLADKNVVKTVIRNLVSNAIKFTKDCGSVEVSYTASSSDEVDTQGVIAVKDNGIGMSDEVKASLFTPHNAHVRQGTRNETGTGLGLALCRQLIEMHGGRFWIESAEGVGTSCYFTL